MCVRRDVSPGVRRRIGVRGSTKRPGMPGTRGDRHDATRHRTNDAGPRAGTVARRRDGRPDPGPSGRRAARSACGCGAPEDGGAVAAGPGLARSASVAGAVLGVGSVAGSAWRDGALLALASMGGTFTMGWMTRGSGFRRLPVLSASAPRPRRRRPLASIGGRAVADATAPEREADAIAIGPGVGRPRRRRRGPGGLPRILAAR